MVLLPVVERELRVAARGRALYRVRFWAVLGMVAIFAWNIMSLQQNQPASQIGLQLMAFLTLWAFVFSLLIGVIATSDCVSHEKREGTLGLLFLTDLKGYDVICGKLAANSINALYALVATLPIMGIPLLMGGVTFLQLSKVALVLISTMVFSLAVGVFVSTYSRNERMAMVFTILILLGATFLLPFLLELSLPDTFGRGSDVWIALMFSPGYGLLQTMGPMGWPPSSFFFSVLWQWLMAAALIARASAHVPHSWEESGAARNPFPRFFNPTLFRWSKTGSHRQWLEINPFLWLAMRDEASRWRVWLFVGSIFLIWLIGVLKYGMGMLVDQGLLAVTILVLHWPLKIWIAAEASRRFVEDRSNNTFEFLLSTLLTERQIIRGQWLALWKQFAGPVLAILVWESFLVFYLHRHHGWWDTGAITSPLLSMFFLVLDAVALGWVGMWLGLVCKGRTRAILGSLALVVMVPWVLFLIYYVLDTFVAQRWLFTSGFGARSSGLGVPTTTIRLCYGLLMNGVAIFWIRLHLPKDLRRLATER